VLHQNEAPDSTVPTRVLVVDDDRDCADSLNILLSKMGHDCVPLYHPKTVVDYAHFYRPDLMLIDLAMPKLDGYELIRQLRADRPRSEAALIAISGFADTATRQMAFEAGFDGFLVKPFGLHELKSLIAYLDEVRDRARALRMNAEDLRKYAKETNSCSAELIQSSMQIQKEWNSLIDEIKARRPR
jgi:DNA-binding response OmpR family regulator